MSKKSFKSDVDNMNPYEVDKLSKIPSLLIIIVLKYWAVAAAVFFTTIGGVDIGLDFSEIDSTDIMVQWEITAQIIIIIAFGLTILFTYAVKPIVHLLHNRRNNTLRYNMVNVRGFLSIVVVFIYMFILSIILFFIIMFLSAKGWVFNLLGNTGYGIEPFSYALYFIIIDGILVLIKNLIWNIYQRYKFNKQIKES